MPEEVYSSAMLLLATPGKRPGPSEVAVHIVFHHRAMLVIYAPILPCPLLAIHRCRRFQNAGVSHFEVKSRVADRSCAHGSARVDNRQLLVRHDLQVWVDKHFPFEGYVHSPVHTGSV